MYDLNYYYYRATTAGRGTPATGSQDITNK